MPSDRASASASCLCAEASSPWARSAEVSAIAAKTRRASGFLTPAANVRSADGIPSASIGVRIMALLPLGPRDSNRTSRARNTAAMSGLGDHLRRGAMLGRDDRDQADALPLHVDQLRRATREIDHATRVGGIAVVDLDGDILAVAEIGDPHPGLERELGVRRGQLGLVEALAAGRVVPAHQLAAIPAADAHLDRGSLIADAEIGGPGLATGRVIHLRLGCGGHQDDENECQSHSRSADGIRHLRLPNSLWPTLATA